MHKFFSAISVIIERVIFDKIYSFLFLLILRLRGMRGGQGLSVHGSVRLRGWLCEIEMGKNVVFHKGVNIVVSRNSKLIFKDKSWISYNSVIIASTGTKTIIGENTMFGGNCTIVSADHDICDVPSLRETGHIVGDIIIGDNCWIGANCVITKGVTIGNGAIIGAGSIVTKDIPPYTIAVGAPARVMKNRELKSLI